MTRRAKSKGVRRDWHLARAKVDGEGACRVCGRMVGAGVTVEAAHVIGREHDFEAPLRWPLGADWITASRVLVSPTRIVPLCGPVGDGSSCHGRRHAGELDLLKHLSVEEQAQAVADAGGLTLALARLSPALAVGLGRYAAGGSSSDLEIPL